MNRRQKIIVSITGIFIVLLALVGLTYAYFLTRITGNEEDKSISVTTANLELTYGDGNGILLPAGLIEPSDKNIKFYVSNEETDDPIDVLLDSDNNPIVKENKTFTVTNNGEDSSYVVIIDETETKYASNGSYIDEDNQIVTYNKGDATEFLSNDFRYTLTCTVKDNQGNVLNDEKCNGAETKSIFPIKGGILVGNAIEKEKVHEYTLTMWYIDTGKDQSDDMNKTYQARVNISDVNQMENPFKTGNTETDKKNLAYNIIENAKDNKNGTELLNVPETKVAEEISYTRGTGKFEKEEELDMSSQSEWYYGSTAEDAKPWSGGSSEGTVTTCDETIIKGKYISYAITTEYWYVKSCKSSTVAIVGVGNNEILEYESSLLTTQDDYGTSYYYRGNVEDNYVTFAGMCWRIVRIDGNGNTKLILEDQDQPCSTSINGNWAIPTTTGGTTYTGNFGYTEHSGNTLTASDGTKNSSTKYLMDYLHGQADSTSSMPTAFKNFQSTFTETELSKLKAGNWCLGDNAYDSSNNLLNSTQIMDNKIKGTSFNYDSYQRLGGNNGYQQSLKCNGTIMNDWDDNETNPTPMYVGAITADEIVYAGGKYGTNNQNYYLINSEFEKETIIHNNFWLLSPCNFISGVDDAFFLTSDGGLGNFSVAYSEILFRPSVSLKSGITMTTNPDVATYGEPGTIGNPYVIG